VVYTRDEALYWEAKRFADRGKPFNLDGGTNVRAGLNLNGNDLSAAIGRVQLGKLPSVISRRRDVAARVKAGISDLKAVRAGRELADVESTYWFLRFHLDVGRLSVDKARFVQAVAAEGIPVAASYRHIPAEATWFRERCVFPGSDYPWGLPAYQGDRKAVFPCPNAVAAAEEHFTLSIHENLTQGEVDDILTALRKVEEAYLR